MKLKIKDIGLATGGPYIAVLNEEDARQLDLSPLDRIKIKARNSIIAVVNIAEHSKEVKKGELGLFEEVLAKLKLNKNKIVEISLAKKPDSISYIKDKLDGKELNEDKIKGIIDDISENRLSEVELTYFISGCYTNGLSMDEIVALTKSIGIGDRLKLGKNIIVDKHSIGGVSGNRTTMIIVPILAAAGLTIPKTSSRAITSAAGTADVMEVLANVELPIKKIKQVIKKTNACMIWGGTGELAGADDRLIKIERPLSLDPKGILLASVMSKKLSVGSKYVLIDISIGDSAKIKNKREAVKLRKKFVQLGRKLKIKVKVIFTLGDQPVGNGVGPVLEARDVMYVLKGDSRRPLDLERKAVMMANIIFKMVKHKKDAIDILDSGEAYKKMLEIIKAQGKKKVVGVGRFSHDVKSKKSGVVKSIDNKLISKMCRLAGAPKDKGAGIYFYAKIGDNIKKNDKIFTIYAENKHKLDEVIKKLEEIQIVSVK